MATVLEQAMHLSIEEKLDLISALWESMSEHPESIPVPAWQLKELERRIEAQRLNPQPGEIWDEVKRELIEVAQSATPEIGVVSTRIVRTIGRLLAEIPTMQDYVNGALERIIVDYIAPWRNEISNFIAEVVKSWDGPKVAEIIELEVGSDLQYIRINGTLVGAAIGMLLFLIGTAIPALRAGLAGWHFW